MENFHNTMRLAIKCTVVLGSTDISECCPKLSMIQMSHKLNKRTTKSVLRNKSSTGSNESIHLLYKTEKDTIIVVK